MFGFLAPLSGELTVQLPQLGDTGHSYVTTVIRHWRLRQAGREDGALQTLSPRDLSGWFAPQALCVPQAL
jgi:hypothetical protein